MIGRFDPKLDRKTSTMIIKSLHLESGVQPDEKMISEVAASMRDFLSFHNTLEIKFEDNGNLEFKNKLQQAL